MQRRTFIKGSMVVSMVSFFGSSLSAKILDKNLLNFEAVAASSKDEIVIPKGYEAKVLISWGDALFSKAKPFDESKKIDDFALKNANLVFGDNNDGMSLFEISSQRAILAINNEYINPELMFHHHGKNLSKNDILYEQASVGVSVFEIEKQGEFYQVVLDSKFNRRIDANTKMKVSGAAKNEVLQNQKFVFGTLANCANGQTPWGTYLTCEENFDDFFGSTNKNLVFDKSQKRYGFKIKSEYGWENFDERFDLAKSHNVSNHFGWACGMRDYRACF